MLTDKQKESFHANGYLVVDDVFDQETILEPVRKEYENLLDELVDGWISEGKIAASIKKEDFYTKLMHCYEAGCDWFQPMDISLPGNEITENTPMHFGPAVFKLLTADRLLDIVEDLIGPEITSNPIQHVRLKPPAKRLHQDEVRPHIGNTAWHQDRGVAHDEADATDMVTVWCAVNDATVSNGCLQVIPKKTEQSLLPHCPQRQTTIADGFLEQSNAIPLPVKSGGILILHPLTPHASLDNMTNKFRWSFDIRFNKTGQPTGRSHFPEFIARSKADPGQVLTDWKAWKKSWEEARKKLSTQSHIPIHRWTSDAPFCA